MFDIPIVLFIFRRRDKSLRILERISLIKPKKLYLISDGPRNEVEYKEVKDCREAVESRVDWNCEIVTNYAEVNKGVFDRIGKGSLWVFEREKRAIFLEDDNLPEMTFFDYCEELLERYENNDRVLWICGTNYLGLYEPEDGASYVFTSHLLPCGWASWSEKFIRFYDSEMKQFNEKFSKRQLRHKYESKALFRQQFYSFSRTKSLLQNNTQSASWDFQMAFSLRVNDMYGISPSLNQIRNIGVDNYSEHGGTSSRSVMTRRFTGMTSYILSFPLQHPKEVEIDEIYERKISKLILYPWYWRLIRVLARPAKVLLGINKYDSLTVWIKKRFFRRNTL